MDIMTRKVSLTRAPDIKVTILFRERPHGPKQREAISEEITKLVGRWSRRELAKVQVDIEYMKA